MRRADVFAFAAAIRGENEPEYYKQNTAHHCRLNLFSVGYYRNRCTCFADDAVPASCLFLLFAQLKEALRLADAAQGFRYLYL